MCTSNVMLIFADNFAITRCITFAHLRSSKVHCAIMTTEKKAPQPELHAHNRAPKQLSTAVTYVHTKCTHTRSTSRSALRDLH